jgi:cytidylate kinase
MILGTLQSNKISAKAAEHQMRQWALGLEIRHRREDERATRNVSDQIHPFVSISREAGAGGEEIGTLVGQRLGWKVVDREILDYIAEKYNLSRYMLDVVDENTCNWMRETFGKWLDSQLVTQSEYVVHLGQIALLAAQHANTVFIGRATQFTLPREKGLVVRIISPLKMRVLETARQRNLTHEAAREIVDEVDKHRQEFIKHYFHKDVTDPHLYDLVINRQHYSMECAVDLIVDQCRRRFGALH